MRLMSQCENRCHIASRPNGDVLGEQPFTLMSGVTSRSYASRVARKGEGDIRAMLLGHTPIACSCSAEPPRLDVHGTLPHRLLPSA